MLAISKGVITIFFWNAETISETADDFSEDHTTSD